MTRRGPGFWDLFPCLDGVQIRTLILTGMARGSCLLTHGDEGCTLESLP